MSFVPADENYPESYIVKVKDSETRIVATYLGTIDEYPDGEDKELGRQILGTGKKKDAMVDMWRAYPEPRASKIKEDAEEAQMMREKFQF